MAGCELLNLFCSDALRRDKCARAPWARELLLSFLSFALMLVAGGLKTGVSPRIFPIISPI